ncbi:hypothetical protein PLICRDRAFT_47589 [Plicaturopsis crispa FD-325 SS-3]|nr:hypothetical protein PLICRDRAFT_47589 [Plicaturopsis crispa FD-325 SS-3]
MPAPAVYIVAVIGGVAAVIAFKEFVYEPHIAPKMEQWAASFVEKRKQKRLQKQRQRAVAVSVPLEAPDAKSRTMRRKRSDASDYKDADNARSSFELENFSSKDVYAWRHGVDRSQGELRHRKNPSQPGNALDESNISIPFVPMTPTHVLFDPSSPSTPTSTAPSLALPPTPSRQHTPQNTPPRIPSPPPAFVRSSPNLPTPAPSSPGLSPFIAASAPSVRGDSPDGMRDLEIISASSQAPGSPFSPLSNVMSPAQAISELDLLSASEPDDDEYESFVSSETQSNVTESHAGSAFEEDDFDVRSVHGMGSEASSWASVHGSS